MSESGEITRLLRRLTDGDESAVEALIPLVYHELRRLAASSMRVERPDHTLSPTALVHEAYLRLFHTGQPDWQDRRHFYGIAARAMRQLLVEHARLKRASKRGGGLATLSLDIAVSPATGLWDAVDLDLALQTLEKLDPRKGKAVELHFFGGLSMEETGEVLGVSTATISRDLRMAQAWLAQEVRGQ